MGNVALMFKEMGHEVLGVDQNIYPPMSDVLHRSEIEIFSGYNAERLELLNPDLVVVGNVVSRGNEEIEWLLETRSIEYCSLSELLKNQVLKSRENIVVAGTHGKTTTSCLAAYILTQVGACPGYLIGGVPNCLPSGSCLGKKDAPFVIEGDEYDTAFFDKRSKFVHYLPNVLIINNLEFDHADIFRDLEDIQRSFSHLLRLVPRNGYILVNGDDQNVKELLPVKWTTVFKVGVGDPSKYDLAIVDFKDTPTGSIFTLFWQGSQWGKVEWGLNGIHNARNAAMAALAAGLVLSKQNPQSLNLGVIKEFSGVKRRQEVLFNDGQCAVIEDFAHHPTAVAETLTALKAKYPDYFITACFELRSNTTCRKFHQETLPEALTVADEVYIGPLHRGENLDQSDRFDVLKAVIDLCSKDVEAHKVESFEGLLAALRFSAKNKRDLQQKHLVCFFTNGAFGGVIQGFVNELKSVSAGDPVVA